MPHPHAHVSLRWIASEVQNAGPRRRRLVLLSASSVFLVEEIGMRLRPKSNAALPATRQWGVKILRNQREIPRQHGSDR